MNTKELFSPETAATAQKNQGRNRVKVAVFSVVAVHVAGLTALLLTQGCKRNPAPEPEPQPQAPAMDISNVPPAMDISNVPPTTATGSLPGGESLPQILPPTEPLVPAMTKYVIQSGDSFYSIGKAHGVSQKAIEVANPGIDSKKLKLKQEINLPAPAPAGGAVNPPAADTGGPTMYTVKSGDTLSKLATHFGTSAKAIKALNGLSTDQIKVNQKLKIPAKAAPAPIVDPVVPTMPVPAAAPAAAPAPGH